MSIYLPEFSVFGQLAAGHNLVPVYRQLVADTLTPVSAFCKLQSGSCAFLFESVVGGEKIGRYSFVGTDPFLRLEAFGHEVSLTECGEGGRPIDGLDGRFSFRVGGSRRRRTLGPGAARACRSAARGCRSAAPIS